MLVFGAQDSNKVGEIGTEEVLIVFKFFFSYSCVTLKLHLVWIRYLKAIMKKLCSSTRKIICYAPYASITDLVKVFSPDLPSN